MLLNELRAPIGANKKKKRLGRGESSGHGKTSGKGHKGQKARSGGYHKVGFEGGQMPLVRRLPKRGFANIFKKDYAVVNIGDFQRCAATKEIDISALKKAGCVKNSARLLKVLGSGDLAAAVTVTAHKFSASAVQKIEKAGGKAVTIQ